MLRFLISLQQQQSMPKSIMQKKEGKNMVEKTEK